MLCDAGAASRYAPSARLHYLGHDPVIIAKATNSLEALALKHCQSAVVQERIRNLAVRHIFGITLDNAAAKAGDFLKGTRKSDG